MNRNESYREKNRGPTYVPRFVTLSDDNNDNEEMKDNKIDEENKENIPDNEPPRASASNKDIQTLPAQEEEEEYS